MSFNTLYCTDVCLQTFREAKGLHLLFSTATETSAGNVGLLQCFLHCNVQEYTISYTVVSRKYAPPFTTLALVQSAGGYTQDATFSLAITPPLD